MTNIIDADTHQLLLMVEGRSAQALADFAKELPAHQACPEQIRLISMDMSEAYQKGAREGFPWANRAKDVAVCGYSSKCETRSFITRFGFEHPKLGDIASTQTQALQLSMGFDCLLPGPDTPCVPYEITLLLSDIIYSGFCLGINSFFYFRPIKLGWCPKRQLGCR